MKTPLLTCANWGGQGIHPRGNFNGYIETPADTPKWLEAHGDSHWSLFSSKYGLDLQKRFFDYHLKGVRNGWDRQPRVLLNVRHPGERFVLRHENEWPIARTQWTKFCLDPARSKPWRPFHPHDRVEPLTPGEICECDIEFVTSSIPAAARRPESVSAH